ncbi:MAG TPA: GAF domain-containing protein [bacterium]|nr:GAF domain-containing protein [bacterium]
MNRACYSCGNSIITEVNIGNKKHYYCASCEKTLERFRTLGNEVFEEKSGKEIKHVTLAVAIFNKQGQILLVKRRVWPYLYALPAGHMERGETPEDGIKREMIEELGLNLSGLSLIYHKTIPDECRYGGNIHEWYLFKTTINEEIIFENSEIEKFGWYSLPETEKLEMPKSVRRVLTEAILEPKTQTIISSSNYVDTRALATPFKDRQTELLYHISQALFSSHDMEHILNIASREVISAFDISSITIHLYKKAYQKDVEISNAKNGQKKSIPTPKTISTLSKKIVSSKKVVTNYSDPSLGHEQGSIIGVPLIAHGQVVGILLASDKKRRYFTEEEVQTLSILSTLIALAIENSRLHLKQEEKIKNLSELFSIAAGTSNKVKNTIEKMTDTVPDLFNAEKALLLLLDNDPKTLKVFAHSGISDQNTILSEKITLEKDSISKSVFETGRAYISNHTAKSKKILPLFRSKLKIRSILSVPVITQSHCIGVLHLINKNEDGFNEEDARLAMVVASRIGIKIENAILQERTNSEKELLNNVIENTNEGIIVVDSEGKIRIWNKYLQRLTGLSCHRVINRLDHTHSKRKDFCGEIAVLIQDALRNRSVSYLEKELPISDGVTAWFGITASYISDREGNLENIVFVLRNISKEKELLLAKNDLISTATHELRTPLTAIKGYLSMLLSNDAGNITPLQHRFLDRAFSSSERLVKLVEDLLSALRIDENRVSVTPKNFDINELIEESIESLKSKAASKRVAFDFDKSKHVYVYADREKSKHIVDNILDNAIKYTKERGKVSISVKDSGHNVLLKIEDTGVGIPQDALATIFDRFTRINNPLSIQAGGTGLGLYIAKSLIERQGGKIWAESTINKGSTFYITMPSPTSISND